MRFCTECGHQLPVDTQFCVNCGEEIIEQEDTNDKSSEKVSPLVSEKVPPLPTTTIAETERQDESPEVVANERSLHKDTDQQSAQTSDYRTSTTEVTKKKSPLMKILVGVIIMIVIGLFGVHKWLERHYDPINDLLAMDEAVTNKDMEAFLSYIHFEDGAMLDKESYFTLIEEFEWSETIRGQLFTIIEDVNETGNPLDAEIYDQYDELMFKVKKEKIWFGLYNKISLIAVPIPLKAWTNLPNTTLSILDETYDVNEDEEVLLAEVYPGIFELKAVSEQAFGPITFEDLLIVSSRLDDVIYIEFDFESFNVDVTYGFEDAIVFVDGKSTDKKISEIESLGPFAVDSDITVYAIAKEKDGIEIVSNMIHLQDDNNGHSLYFAFDEKYKMVAKGIDNDEVAQFILEFRSAYENAVNYVDYSYISDYLKEDSAAEQELKKFVKDMEDGYYHYDFTENTVLNVKEDKKNKYTVTTNEKFEFRDDDFKWYDYDREKVYHVELYDGEFKLTKIEYKDTKKKRI